MMSVFQIYQYVWNTDINPMKAMKKGVMQGLSFIPVVGQFMILIFIGLALIMHLHTLMNFLTTLQTFETFHVATHSVLNKKLSHHTLNVLPSGCEPPYVLYLVPLIRTWTNPNPPPLTHALPPKKVPCLNR